MVVTYLCFIAAEEYQVVKPRGWMTPQPQTQQYENINPRFLFTIT